MTYGSNLRCDPGRSFKTMAKLKQAKPGADPAYDMGEHANEIEVSR